MPSNIHTLIVHTPGRLCYACTTHQDGNAFPKYRTIIYAYEAAVEWIENHDGPFKISQIYYSIGPGPSAHAASNYAVHDMAGHNLVYCVKHDKGQRCMLWDKVK